jgi:hypothetical protein
MGDTSAGTLAERPRGCCKSSKVSQDPATITLSADKSLDVPEGD